MDTRIDSLVESVKQLEAANRRQRNLTLASFVVLALIACTGATQTSNGAATQTQASGAAQTSTGVAQNSSGPLTIKGANGHSITIDGEFIGFQDSTGTTRLSIGFSPDGSAVIDERDASGKTRAMVDVAQTTGNPEVKIEDASGTTRAYVGAYSNGTYGESMYDASGKIVSHQP